VTRIVTRNARRASSGSSNSRACTRCSPASTPHAASPTRPNSTTN
jgi:hypothetical protein